jgi:hypothetical protein
MSSSVDYLREPSFLWKALRPRRSRRDPSPLMAAV